MKGIYSVVLIFTLSFILFSCDEVTPNRTAEVKIDIVGSATRTYVVVAHTSGDSSMSTEWNNVRLPFDLHEFNLKKGDMLSVGCLNWSQPSDMNIQVKVNGELLREASSGVEASLVMQIE